jgi:archaellin
MVDPAPVTVGQLKALSNEITILVKESSGRSPIDLRILETTLRTHDVERLTLSTVVSLVELSAEQLAMGERQYKDLLDNVGIMRLASIMRPKTGSLRVTDVSGLVRLAAKRNKPKADVLESVSIGDLTAALSRSALRTATLSELRSSLEELVSSGLLAKAAG